ncbi:MAG: hypothetical protein JWR19_4003 [Pedosphaera sp.]|jgi:hypothetical protein|nr:hypothetical protein [Pedosphaera sp.]
MMRFLKSATQFIPGSVAFSLAVFISLWVLDFPKPNVDDLFYSGAGLNLASGGDFSNPLLDRQGFPSHYFFVYPPLHSYALGGWLKLLGISAATVTAFPLLSLLLISIATISILRRHGAPVWLEYIVPLGLTCVFLPLGLRPEPFAVALTMVGFALSERKQNSTLLRFLAFLLMFLGASAAPRVTMFAGILALRAGWQSWQADRLAGRSPWRICALWFGAGVLTTLTFLVLIHFRVREFLDTFHLHATRVEGKQLQLLADYAVHVLGVLQWPLVLIPLALVTFSLMRKPDGLSRAGIWIACAFPLVALSGGVGPSTLWWAILVMLLLAGSALNLMSHPAKRALLSALIVLSLLVANRKFFALNIGILSGRIDASRSEQHLTALALRPQPDHPLLVDTAVARYLFDYRLPQGALNLEFGTTFPGAMPGDRNSSELRKGDVFLAGPDTIGLLLARTYLELDIPKWNFLGSPKLGFPSKPRYVYIIPAENCKATRPWDVTPVWSSSSAK